MYKIHTGSLDVVAYFSYKTHWSDSRNPISITALDEERYSQTMRDFITIEKTQYLKYVSASEFVNKK
jgi:hypothetical protein